MPGHFLDFEKPVDLAISTIVVFFITTYVLNKWNVLFTGTYQ